MMFLVDKWWWKVSLFTHWWPSFRDEEVLTSHVRVLPDGEAVSKDGTHLGHNIPDDKGNRYCINLVSVCGHGPVRRSSSSSTSPSPGAAGGSSRSSAQILNADLKGVLGKKSTSWCSWTKTFIEQNDIGSCESSSIISTRKRWKNIQENVFRFEKVEEDETYFHEIEILIWRFALAVMLMIISFIFFYSAA